MDKSAPFVREIMQHFDDASEKMIAVQMGSSFGPTGSVFDGLIKKYHPAFRKKRIPRKLKKKKNQKHG